ncbi:TetR/AcrR family transcriptional regulator [Chitinasiproducens palmae]|uniref:DNA-binding transcriptional regulator, AcrR family n=1 Tax=Chitinasiproducens palmae TaxID=1770053 RepID=A0A1H2PQE4_9BURK|nr:TetR/AcrR family transcriptional regulator [Chitinasiproducens palmae]SDV48969.1 DNA-binding transcriptional regulator, AcrR family [Chitinasiproducens palmae]
MSTAVRKRTQADRTAHSRAALVSAAIAILSDLGFARATTSAIAEHAGVTTGALHHHFPTKESLLFAVLDELTEEALMLFRQLHDLDSSGDGAARGIVTSLWALYGSNRYWAVWEINIGLRPDRTLHDALIEHRMRTREQMRRVIAANESLKDDTKRALAELLPFLLSSMRGIFLDTFFAGHEAEWLDRQLERLIHALDREMRSI